MTGYSERRDAARRYVLKRFDPDTGQWVEWKPEPNPDHHNHCQHELPCCRCEGRQHIQIREERSPAELREAIRGLTNSGGT